MFGLIGYPLGHSFSANYFNSKFDREGIDNSYHLFPIKSISELPSLLKTNNQIEGLNVTIPYKEAVIPFLQVLSDDAAQIGAVNTIKIIHRHSMENPSLIGFNTDWKGFSISLYPLLKPSIDSALILGTGGASKAVKYALDKLGIKCVTVSRYKSKGDLIYSELTKEIIDQNLLIVNTTPLGMIPDVDSAPPIPYKFLTDSHVCYDLIYNPEFTEFMRCAKLMGATVKNGLEMLHLQAELSWEIWKKH